MPGGPERLLHTDQQHLRLLFPDHDRRRHRPDVHRFGNQGRPARHIPREAAQRPEDMDPVLQGRHVLQLDHRRHRTFAPERHQGVFGSRQAAAAGRRRGHPLVLLLAADLHLRRRALLHGRRLRPRSARPRGQTAAHVGRGDAHRADRGPRIVSGRTAPHPHERGCGQPRRSRHGPHAHRQTRHVEQGLRQGARSHRRAGTDLRRRPLGLPGFGYSVPDEEHARIDLRGAAPIPPAD